MDMRNKGLLVVVLFLVWGAAAQAQSSAERSAATMIAPPSKRPIHAVRASPKELRGTVLHVDRFGSLGGVEDDGAFFAESEEHVRVVPDRRVQDEQDVRARGAALQQRGYG